NTPDSLVIELLLAHPELLTKLPPVIDDLLPNEGARGLLSRFRSGEPPTDLVRALSREAADRVARAWLGDSPYAAPERMLDECLATLSARARDLRRRALTREIAEAERRGDEAAFRALVEEKRRLDAAAAPAKADGPS
ncbi:MAG TPA: hypothetical protein VLF14_00835, partial [Candidatus Binatia bacterium]|nr:hypothetical protein [Candidatus Binatia bacterium]